MDKTLDLRLSASGIKRYHMHPIVGEQTVGEHTYRGCQILRYIAAGRENLPFMVTAFLDHDVAEAITGDIPFTAKNKFPQLKTATARAEDKVFAAFSLDTIALTTEEWAILKQADLLEMCTFGIRQLAMGNRFGMDVVENTLAALDSMPSLLDRTLELMGEFDVMRRKYAD
jgi:5'-deoxynucleotidase YfbR-like HD superfamily hydrolase